VGIVTGNATLAAALVQPSAPTLLH